jgi:cytidine deaminase
MSESSLIEAARASREFAVAPYSDFKVGAALLAADGTVFTGCNVENASFGLTMCAERIAIFKAISEGKSEFKALAVSADTDKLTPPCGACRQVIWEFCGDIPVTLSNLKDRSRTVMMSEILPNAFDGSFLK